MLLSSPQLPLFEGTDKHEARGQSRLVRQEIDGTSKHWSLLCPGANSQHLLIRLLK